MALGSLVSGYTFHLASITFDAKDPVEDGTAVQFDDTTGKLIPCSDATKFVGIVNVRLDPSLATLRVVAADQTVPVVHKGYAKIKLPAGTYIKGQPLTIDTANPGKLKPVSDPTTETTIARVAEESVTLSTDYEDDVLIFIL